MPPIRLTLSLALLSTSMLSGCGSGPTPVAGPTPLPTPSPAKVQFAFQADRQLSGTGTRSVRLTVDSQTQIIPIDPAHCTARTENVVCSATFTFTGKTSVTGTADVLDAAGMTTETQPVQVNLGDGKTIDAPLTLPSLVKRLTLTSTSDLEVLGANGAGYYRQWQPGPRTLQLRVFDLDGAATAPSATRVDCSNALWRCTVDAQGQVTLIPPDMTGDEQRNEIKVTSGDNTVGRYLSLEDVTVIQSAFVSSMIAGEVNPLPLQLQNSRHEPVAQATALKITTDEGLLADPLAPDVRSAALSLSLDAHGQGVLSVAMQRAGRHLMDFTIGATTRVAARLAAYIQPAAGDPAHSSVSMGQATYHVNDSPVAISGVRDRFGNLVYRGISMYMDGTQATVVGSADGPNVGAAFPPTTAGQHTVLVAYNGDRMASTTFTVVDP